MNVFKYLVETCSPAICYKIAGRLPTVKNEHPQRLDGINVQF